MFVIWCLHTDKRRPCSSTLSGHPSSSFWLLQQFQQLRCDIRSLSRTLHFPSFLVVMCSPLPVSEPFKLTFSARLPSDTGDRPTLPRGTRHFNVRRFITRRATSLEHGVTWVWDPGTWQFQWYIYLQTAWLQVKTWSPSDVRNGSKWCHMCWPLLTRRASKRLLHTLSLVDTSALRERRNFYDFRNLNQDEDEDEEWKDSVSRISIW